MHGGLTRLHPRVTTKAAGAISGATVITVRREERGPPTNLWMERDLHLAVRMKIWGVGCIFLMWYFLLSRRDEMKSTQHYAGDNSITYTHVWVHIVGDILPCPMRREPMLGC